MQSVLVLRLPSQLEQGALMSTVGCILRERDVTRNVRADKVNGYALGGISNHHLVECGASMSGTLPSLGGGSCPPDVMCACISLKFCGRRIRPVYQKQLKEVFCRKQPKYRRW
eukprot:scaffold82310_cov30-Tisochrysis_lutea.AAC.2